MQNYIFFCFFYGTSELSWKDHSKKSYQRIFFHKYGPSIWIWWKISSLFLLWNILIIDKKQNNGSFGTTEPPASWWNDRRERLINQLLLGNCWVFDWNPAEWKEACSSAWIWIGKFFMNQQYFYIRENWGFWDFEQWSQSVIFHKNPPIHFKSLIEISMQQLEPAVFEKYLDAFFIKGHQYVNETIKRTFYFWKRRSLKKFCFAFWPHQSL